MFLFEEILPAEPSVKFAKLGHFLVVVADYHSDEVDTSRGQTATPTALPTMRTPAAISEEKSEATRRKRTREHARRGHTDCWFGRHEVVVA